MMLGSSATEPHTSIETPPHVSMLARGCHEADHLSGRFV
jgi:hypothetical protein